MLYLGLIMKIEIRSKKINGKEVLFDINLDLEKRFTLIVGRSGSGKTSLINELVPRATRESILDGEVTYKGMLIDKVPLGVISYISKNPDSQLFQDNVWNELALGLEELGIRPSEIKLKVAEMATFFGISDWMDKEVNQLSVGQKQKLCIITAVCQGVELIVMDEPTAMLDFVATREFWDFVKFLRRTTNTAFIVAENNTDYVWDLADEIIEMDNGTVAPSWALSSCPFDQQLGYRLLGVPARFGQIKRCSSNVDMKLNYSEIEESSVYYSISMSEKENNFLSVDKLIIPSGVSCWIGPNGAGKTTLAEYLSKIYNVTLMPQNVVTAFSKKTVREELEYENQIYPFVEVLLDSYLDRNPLELSDGEQHLIMSAKFLMRDAGIVVLDEPTMGMDSTFVSKFKRLVDFFRDRTIVIISNDLNLVGDIADYVVFLFNGEIVTQGEPHNVFKKFKLYKPLVSCIFPEVVSVDEVN